MTTCKGANCQKATFCTATALLATIMLCTSIGSTVMDRYWIYNVPLTLCTIVCAAYMIVALVVLLKAGGDLWVTPTFALLSGVNAGTWLGLVQVKEYDKGLHDDYGMCWGLSPLLGGVGLACLALWHFRAFARHRWTHRFNAFVVMVYLSGALAFAVVVPSLNDMTGLGPTSWFGIITGLIILSLFYGSWRYSKWCNVTFVVVAGVLAALMIVDSVRLTTKEWVKDGETDPRADTVFDIISRAILIVLMGLCLGFKLCLLPPKSRPVRSDSVATAASGDVEASTPPVKDGLQMMGMMGLDSEGSADAVETHLDQSRYQPGAFPISAEPV